MESCTLLFRGVLLASHRGIQTGFPRD